MSAFHVFTKDVMAVGTDENGVETRPSGAISQIEDKFPGSYHASFNDYALPAGTWFRFVHRIPDEEITPSRPQSHRIQTEDGRYHKVLASAIVGHFKEA